MSKHFVNKKCLCPFYKYEYKCKIFCAGKEPVLAVHHVFEDKQRMRSFQQEKCYKQENQCALAVGMKMEEYR